MKPIETKHHTTSTGIRPDETLIQSTVITGPDNILRRNVKTFMSWETVQEIALLSTRKDPARMIELRDALQAEIDAQEAKKPRKP